MTVQNVRADAEAVGTFNLGGDLRVNRFDLAWLLCRSPSCSPSRAPSRSCTSERASPRPPLSSTKRRSQRSPDRARDRPCVHRRKDRLDA
jgi:hypothetical protein